MPVPLAPLALLAGGAVLTFTAIEDPVGGPLQVVRDLLAGKTPSAGIQIFTTIPHGAGNAGGDEGFGGESNSGGAGEGSSKGATVAAEARKWLGVPYQFGGSTRKGIDCSGLVKVCYAKVGLNLPHFATSIGLYGHAVPRDQAAAGDVVLWGTPANYPHCAIAINNTQCIAAWTYGVGVQIKSIDIKAVSGYGYPVIHRLV
jgi:cell wall-associated NlpC family hydrolase